MNLDDLDAIAKGDPGDALGAVERTADQWAEALGRARAAENLPDASGIRNVVFCGMGGSGIAGDVVAALEPRVPVIVSKGYGIPAFTGPDTLVIAASYSGNTEETLSAFAQARDAGARMVCITTGGKLASLAEDEKLPNIEPVKGLQPRAALASLAVPAIVVLERLGVLDDQSRALADTEDLLRARTADLGRARPLVENEAKQFALALDGKIPLVWGQEGVLAVAAIRWRCQINENAKAPAFSSVLSELDHNEIVGYDPGVPALKDIALVVLRAPGEHPRQTLRIAATLDAIGEKVGGVMEAWGTGASPLARMMTTIALGDFASAYLALLRGVDPSPVPVIEGLKKRLG
jgi:glucose/mannose-6-phosphate isomerase